jgi:RimJ/RimL family protein N-acetyltransferase
MALVDHWPLFGLRVRTPRLELVSPTDELAAELGELAVQGIHDPATMPFSTPWTDAPADELPRNCVVHYWSNRVSTSPKAWHLSLAVLVDGEPVGAGGLIAEGFAVRRTFETGSWLGRAFQGRGLGVEFRQACLHLGFAGLGAMEATTGAYHDNAASLGVTGRLPYEPNGEVIQPRRDGADRLLQFRMPRANWETIRRDDIAIEGLEPCLSLLLGTDSTPGAGASPPMANPGS